MVLTIISSNIHSQWYLQYSGTSENLSDVFFIDENTGWACGWNGIIIKTTNGGFT